MLSLRARRYDDVGCSVVRGVSQCPVRQEVQVRHAGARRSRSRRESVDADEERDTSMSSRPPPTSSMGDPRAVEFLAAFTRVSLPRSSCFARRHVLTNSEDVGRVQIGGAICGVVQMENRKTAVQSPDRLRYLRFSEGRYMYRYSCTRSSGSVFV